ncbi:Helix-turn-helix domain-containing protein, partial [Alteribacillus persepolensis]
TSLRYKSYYVKDIEDIRVAYESFFQLKIYNFFCREADVLTFDYIENTKEEVNYYSVNSLLQEIKETINYNIVDPKLMNLIEKLFFKKIKPSLSYNLYYYCYTFLSSILMDKYHRDYSKDLLQSHSPQELFFSSIEQKYNEFIELLHLIKGDPSNRHMIKNPIVFQAIDLVHNQYQNSISINYMAKHLNVSQPYLSQIFTKEMGISLQKYLITYRMQKAKDMISTSHDPIYSIAAKVGYLDVKHFSKTFKKVTGFSPMQYKKTLQQSGKGRSVC